jgi:rRNA N6-adenosine-methyltransferase METTL5
MPPTARELSGVLAHCAEFAEPKVRLEQYATSAAVAAECLLAAQAHLLELKLSGGRGEFGAIRSEDGSEEEGSDEDDEDEDEEEEEVTGFTGLRVADLGCGGGVLGVGTACLGASSIMFADVDPDALRLARENAVVLGLLREDPEEDASPDASEEDASLDSDEAADELWRRCSADFVLADILAESVVGPPWRTLSAGDRGATETGNAAAPHPFDVAVMNPPFGTKQELGADLAFVRRALELAPVVYSLHKSSTRRGILRRAVADGFSVKVIAQMRWRLAQTMSFHKRKYGVSIDVDFICHWKPPAGEKATCYTEVLEREREPPRTQTRGRGGGRGGPPRGRGRGRGSRGRR